MCATALVPMLGAAPAEAQVVCTDFNTGTAAGATAGGNSTACGPNAAAGNGSAAFGSASTAGDNGSAFGASSTATGVSSSAFGVVSQASGTASLALGAQSTASGFGSVAAGLQSDASGASSSAIGSSSSASAARSAAFGADARATQTDAVAVGAFATASGSGSLAFGLQSTAGGDAAVAIGPVANAAFANSAALGNGATATRVNQQAFGTAANTYTMAGIASAASRAAQTGPTQLVTSDASGNLATTSLADLGIASTGDLAAINARLNDLDGRASRALTGVAMAFAMAGVPSLLPSETFAVTMNWGTYEGKNGTAFNAAFRLAPNMQLTGGVAVGVEERIVGGRAGLRIGW